MALKARSVKRLRHTARRRTLLRAASVANNQPEPSNAWRGDGEMGDLGETLHRFRT